MAGLAAAAAARCCGRALPPGRDAREPLPRATTIRDEATEVINLMRRRLRQRRASAPGRPVGAALGGDLPEREFVAYRRSGDGAER